MKRVLLILLALILPPLLYFPTVAPRRKAALEKAESELEELNMRVQRALAAQRKLTEFRAEAENLDRELKKLRRILPAEMDLDGLRAATNVLAADHEVRLVRFEPRAITEAPPLHVVSIDVDVTGDAAGTAAFLQKLETTSRILDVSEVSLTKDPAGWRTMFLVTTRAMR